MFMMDEPLPEGEREAIFATVAEQVVKRRLQTPAILALEMHRPLGTIAGHGLVFFTPLLAPLIGLQKMETLARLLLEEGAIEQLIRRIEEKSEAQNEPMKPAQPTQLVKERSA